MGWTGGYVLLALLLAPYLRGVGIVFSRFLQVAQYFILIIAYLIPAVAIAWILTGNPIPQVALCQQIHVGHSLDHHSINGGYCGTSPRHSALLYSPQCASSSLFCWLGLVIHCLTLYYGPRYGCLCSL